MMTKEMRAEFPDIRSALNLIMPQARGLPEADERAAFKAGRKDRHVTVRDDGLTPWLWQEQQKCSEKIFVISQDFRDQIAATDRSISQTVQEIVNIEVDASRGDELLPAEGNTQRERALHVRAMRRQNDARTSRKQRLELLKVQLTGLLETRINQHKQARDTVSQVCSGFGIVAGAYRRGQEHAGVLERLLGQRARYIDKAMPKMVPDVEWLSQDLPLMDMKVDPSVEGVIAWGYRAFLPSVDRDDDNPVGATLL